MKAIFLVCSILICNSSVASVCDRVLPFFYPDVLEEYFDKDRIINSLKNKNDLYTFFQAMLFNGEFKVKESATYDYYMFLLKYSGRNESEIPIKDIIKDAKPGNKYIIEYLINNISPNHVSYRDLVRFYMRHAFDVDRDVMERLWILMEDIGGYDEYVIVSNIYSAAEAGSKKSILRLLEIYKEKACDRNFKSLSILVDAIEDKNYKTE